MITVALLLLAQPQDPALSAALDKLAASEGITFTFVDRTVGGTTSKWTLKAKKPNLLTADSELHTIVADGSTIVVLSKSANSYTSEEQTEASLAKLLQRPELLPARLFLDPKGKWLERASSAGSRKRRGVDLTGTLLPLSRWQSATVYFGKTDKAINYFMIETKNGETTEARILDDFKTVQANHAASSFVFKPSPGARNASDADSGPSDGELADIAAGSIPYRQLAWDDYPIVTTSPANVLARTNVYIRHSYKTLAARSGSGYVARVTSIEVRSGMDPTKSFRRAGLSQESLDRLLRHEQIHLDINEIEAKKLRAMKLSDLPKGSGPSPSAATSNLKQLMNKMLKDAAAEAHRRQVLYDSETKHGTVASAQGRWEDTVARQLRGG